MIIYKATNKINNKSYIGQTIYTLEKRKSGHIFESNNNSDTIFHRAIRKYGKENFEWEVIDDTAKDIDELNLLEQKYIKEYDTFGKQYNMTIGGGGISGFIVTDETREKLRIAQLGKKLSDETRRKISDANTGKITSEETKLKISKSNIGKIIPKSVRNKISKSCKNRPQSVNENMKLGWKNKPIETCPHCNYSSKNNMKRWHFDNCLQKPGNEKLKRPNLAKHLNNKIIECPHCGKEGGAVMKRWHFDNCKNK